MRKITILTFLIIPFVLFLSINKTFACDYSKGTITSVTPQTISTGDILTISGNGFGSIISGENEVHFIFRRFEFFFSKSF